MLVGAPRADKGITFHPDRVTPWHSTETATFVSAHIVIWSHARNHDDCRPFQDLLKEEGNSYAHRGIISHISEPISSCSENTSSNHAVKGS